MSDSTNDPPFLGPISDMGTPKNTPLTFALSSTDLENDPVTYEAILQGSSTANATATVSGNMVTVTPNANFLGPLSLLVDAPRRFGAYHPENFDGDFAGPISATDALARSRNVPAVALAARLTHPTFYETLRRGGVALPREEAWYGLTLPLGGGEVSMEELVRLYAALANDGRLRPLLGI